MLIKSAAHFSVCGCGRHGRIVAANRDESPELCSKEAARGTLDLFVAQGIVLPYEKNEALRQINASSIAETDADTTVADHLKTGTLNLVHDIMLEEAIEASLSSPWVN